MIEGCEPVPGEFWKGFPTQPEGEARRQFDQAYSRWRPGTEQPLFALGYYRISGDNPLTLAADDLFFIARYFSAPHNVVLLAEPASDVPSKATFFYWQHGQI